MARRKANVTPRTKPSQALPPRMARDPDNAGVLLPDFITQPPAYNPKNAERDPDPNNYPASPVVDPGQRELTHTRDPRPGEEDAGPATSGDPTPSWPDEVDEDDTSNDMSQVHDERTLGEMLNINPAVAFSTPVIPDGLMSDEPFPGQTPDDGDRRLAADPVSRAQTPADGDRQLAPAPVQVTPRLPLPGKPKAPAGAPVDVRRDPAGVRDHGGGRSAQLGHEWTALGDAAASVIQYVQRISVTQAYKFDGHVQTAPAWIDRNWLGHDDEARYSHGSGVILEIPGVGKAFVGDYIVQQSVLLDESGERVDQIVVYDREAFERLFLSVASRPSPGASATADGDGPRR